SGGRQLRDEPRASGSRSRVNRDAADGRGAAQVTRDAIRSARGDVDGGGIVTVGAAEAKRLLRCAVRPAEDREEPIVGVPAPGRPEAGDLDAPELGRAVELADHDHVAVRRDGDVSRLAGGVGSGKGTIEEWLAGGRELAHERGLDGRTGRPGPDDVHVA